MSSQIENTVNILRTNILDGRFNAGCLPFRKDLAQTCKTSTYVVNQAIRRLRAEGLLILKGTRVYTQAALDEETAMLATPDEDDQRKLAIEAIEPIIIPTPVGELPYYVYTHSYPEGLLAPDGQDLGSIVFYVGKGAWYDPSLIQRIDMHEHEAFWNSRYAPNEYKFAAIKLIWAVGRSVVKRVIFEFSSESEALDVEGRTLKQFASPYLTNRQQNPFINQRILHNLEGTQIEQHLRSLRRWKRYRGGIQRPQGIQVELDK
jgi:hypothetical protein